VGRQALPEMLSVIHLGSFMQLSYSFAKTTIFNGEKITEKGGNIFTS